MASFFSDEHSKKSQGDFLIKKIHFGAKGGSTYIDHQDKKIMENYIKRHQVNEKWDKIDTAGALARYVLWSKPTTKTWNVFERRSKKIYLKKIQC